MLLGVLPGLQLCFTLFKTTLFSPCFPTLGRTSTRVDVFLALPPEPQHWDGVGQDQWWPPEHKWAVMDLSSLTWDLHPHPCPRAHLSSVLGVQPFPEPWCRVLACSPASDCAPCMDFGLMLQVVVSQQDPFSACLLCCLSSLSGGFCSTQAHSPIFRPASGPLSSPR